MNLFFMPGACSLAVHIGLREAKLPFSLMNVDYGSRKTGDGRDFRKINPKGSVPALMLDDGSILTEVQVILAHIDGMSSGGILLPSGGVERLRALEWLSYISTEIHKSFSPLYRTHTPDEFLDVGRAHLSGRLSLVEVHLSRNAFLLGSEFSAPDAYLYTLCRWLPDQCFVLEHWPNLSRHMRKMAQRTSVLASLKAEGLTTRNSVQI